jgi:6-pyruvoyltetrahydropterin/6-carboxytetrahydropterin synthase
MQDTYRIGPEMASEEVPGLSPPGRPAYHPAEPDPVFPRRPMMQLTRKVRFSAAHRYHRPEWSDERNRDVFGPYIHSHGHDYLLEATVAGEVDPLTGFSVDLAALERVLHEEVVEPLDHTVLNEAVPEFAPGGLVPTTENILAVLWGRIVPRLAPPARLVRLRLHENPDFYVDYVGPEGS